MTGERPATLDEALAILQADLPKVAKNHKANVPTKNGGNYSYSFADLSDCSDALLPKMGPLGLSFRAKTKFNKNGKFVLKYALKHTNGDRETGEWPLPDPDKASPQEIGASVTYGRRYGLCALTGLVPDEDTDGPQQAARPAEQARAQRQQRAEGRDWLKEAKTIQGLNEPAAHRRQLLLTLLEECERMQQMTPAIKRELIKFGKALAEQSEQDKAATG